MKIKVNKCSTHGYDASVGYIYDVVDFGPDLWKRTDGCGAFLKEDCEVIPEESEKDKSTIRVRIIKCSEDAYTYKNKIGQIVDVREWEQYPEWWQMNEGNGECILKIDCEIVETNTPVLTNHTCSICDYADKRIKCPAPIDNPMSVAPENCEHWKATGAVVIKICDTCLYDDGNDLCTNPDGCDCYVGNVPTLWKSKDGTHADNECGDIIDRVAQLEAENSELKTALEKEQKKFKEMLESEHFISDKYLIIRELVGVLNLPADADIFDLTETAILRLKKDRDDAKKELETVKKAEEKNKAMFDNVLSILNDIAPRSPYPNSFHRSFGIPSKIEQLAIDCRDMVKDMSNEIAALNNKVTNLYHREDALLEGMVGLNISLTQARNSVGAQTAQIDPAYRGARI